MLMKLEKMYSTNYFSLLKVAFEIYSEELNWLPHEALQGKNTCQRQTGGKHSCLQICYCSSAGLSAHTGAMWMGGCPGSFLLGLQGIHLEFLIWTAGGGFLSLKHRCALKASVLWLENSGWLREKLLMKMHETWDPYILRKVAGKTLRWDVDYVPHIYIQTLLARLEKIFYAKHLCHWIASDMWDSIKKPPKWCH